VFDFLLTQPLREIRRDVRRAVIRQQTRSVTDGHLSSADANSARSSVAVTSFAFIVAQSFQATMKREKSSSTVER
jgi:hypothetical protein